MLVRAYREWLLCNVCGGDGSFNIIQTPGCVEEPGGNLSICLLANMSFIRIVGMSTIRCFQCVNDFLRIVVLCVFRAQRCKFQIEMMCVMDLLSQMDNWSEPEIHRRIENVDLQTLVQTASRIQNTPS